MIETVKRCYTVPLDQIPPDPLVEDEDPVYETLDEIASSRGSISNILGRVHLRCEMIMMSIQSESYEFDFGSVME